MVRRRINFGSVSRRHFTCPVVLTENTTIFPIGRLVYGLVHYGMEWKAKALYIECNV
tara:strand:- start:130 stop:300 length:171 start_codon:yes stop_codon:yes gene_type:complete